MLGQTSLALVRLFDNCLSSLGLLHTNDKKSRQTIKLLNVCYVGPRVLESRLYVELYNGLYGVAPW
jgi:hypothetical protein